MITITLNNDTKKCFNLSSNDREQALYSAWFSMHDDKKYDDKKLKITTHTNEKLCLKISEIKDCKYEDCVYFDNPEVGDIKKEKELKENPVKTAAENLAKRKEKNMQKFFGELNLRNITVRPDDPFLSEILQYVEKDFGGHKISYYANIYADYHRKLYH